MRKLSLKSLIAAAIVCVLSVGSLGQRVSPSPVQSETEKAVLQACREALAELKYRREIEADLRKQVDELKGIASDRKDQVSKLESAIAKYEAGITARQQAEVLVAELRANHAAQMAVAEKQLAVEKKKVSLWQVLTGVALVIGAFIGYSVGDN